MRQKSPVNMVLRDLQLRHLMIGVSVWALGATGVIAQGDEPLCRHDLTPQPETCLRADAGLTVTMPLGENTERIEASPGEGFSETGFSISLDSAPIAGAPPPPSPARNSDIANAKRHVDLRFDGLLVDRMLNVSTASLRESFRAGEPVRFQSTANYPAYIERAEIRIIDATRRARPVVAIVPISPNGFVDWRMPEDGPEDLAYVLRVYDRAGRYDETHALGLSRTSEAFEIHGTVGGAIVVAGADEDRTRLRNIPTGGGGITVSGTVAPGARVWVSGEEIPVDGAGRYVVNRVLPAGRYEIPVEIVENGRRERISRTVSIPEKENFGVGLVDLTFGRRSDDQQAGNPDYTKTYQDGRIAGYITGTRANGLRYTASVDSGEGPLSEVFQRLDEKDPRKVIQRLDPDDVYPTYGDDSSAYDDAPTSGRFYVRLEKNRTRFTFGDFKAGLTGTDLVSSTRQLYGAEFRHESPSVTPSGNTRFEATIYAASPETLPQRDILRGTGGSVYFLSRQDLNGGSETIAIQVADPVTGRIVSSRTLTVGVDYEIDYIQGVITLAAPLASSTQNGTLISSGSSGELDQNLVAQYEYTPTATALDGASVGGRAQFWATDNLRVGLTAMRENTGPADQDILGADLRYNLGDTSYISAEVAQTSGPGFGRSISTDGGLTIATQTSAAQRRGAAYALDLYLDNEELGLTTPGQIALYFDRKNAGFSTLTEDITSDQTLWGGSVNVALSEALDVGVTFEDFERTDGEKRTEAEAKLSHQLSEKWSVDAALAHLDRMSNSTASANGQRTDLGLRLNYQRTDDQLFYVFGQGTLSRSGQLGRSNRVGAGFDGKLAEKVSLGAEVSEGSGGFGARAQLGYTPTADNEVYLGYTLDPTRTGFRSTSLVGAAEEEFTVGARYKISETTKVYGENNWDIFGDRTSLTRAYGVNYTPNAEWTWSATTESGVVRDKATGDFNRDAFSLGFAYATEAKTNARLRVEYRTEDGQGAARDRDTWALSGGYAYQVNGDWRFLFNIDALISTSDQSSFRDGTYVEASLGYAYRPVLNERLNMLFRYTHLRDLPGADQVTANGSTNGPSQRSHVLSVDAIYDLSEKLSIGAKYGYRKAQIAARGTNNFANNTAQLFVLRADWHITHKWDITADARTLISDDLDVAQKGFLAGIYRHIGNNAKIGLGYEVGRVTDDLTNLDYDSDGLFVNIVAKF